MLVYIFTSTYLYIMKARRDVYQAIADPTRRAIVNIIADKPQNITSIAGQFDMSQQAISLHVKILIDCGLVIIQQQGRDRFCKADLSKLSEVAEWIDQYRTHWESRLDKLEKYVAKLKKERYGKTKK